MFRDHKVIVVMPAYNAAKTLVKTCDEVMKQGCVDEIVVVDDASSDETAKIAETIDNVTLHVHPKNRGYGGNQKSCYAIAVERGADVVIMVHPDYQYTPKLIPAMVALIGNGLYHCVLGSRILGGYALKGGMPMWRYVANRFLTAFGNMLMGSKLSEFHTGYRAFSGELLRKLALDENSDDFVFDNQMLAQVLWHDYMIAEVSCPTRYEGESSSINFIRSCKYGFGCLWTAMQYRLARIGIGHRRFPKG